MRKIKPILTNKKIGVLRFYCGILLGIGYGFLVNLWFKVLDYGFFVVFDMLNHYSIAPDGLLISAYNSFLIGLTSSSLGFCFTMYFWTSRPLSENRKITFKNRFAHINTIFMFMLILFVFTKFLTFSTLLRYDGFGIDLDENYGYLPFLLPVFIFLFNWSTTSRIFKSGKFIMFSGILVIAYGMILAKNQRANIWITGFSIEEMNERINQKEKESKLISEKILGRWTEELWFGAENINIPPPPAAIQTNDSIWPPYYEISKDQIKHFFLEIDSTSYILEKRDNVITLNNLRTNLIGYQKKWRILSISDTIMVIERGYNKYDRNWVDGIDTLKLIKKR
ncbi:hypothetical protein R3X28_03720 [Maribacter sp. TH_r10]|uniref:hypothetical protein n=1 Tax=Maribacter sp. TH_r10 TaxID=3082086 RepID=UPI0029556BEA|nr:hypothetical protein [Maribacter sp. TH_r10]MDV7137967.1 hypothetical protein [Maribacter sp. TH_r10]